MRKLPARKLLVALVAGALFLPDIGFTLGLGEIEVNSALNQKLNADIELLSATVEDTETIIVKLASRKEFSRVGLDRPYLLSDLRFKSEVIDGVPHIKVSSGSPIREPFLNFLVEIDWPNGHLLREYTVLLDPPVFMTQSASTASTPASDDSSFRPGSGGSTNVVPVVVPSAAGSSSRPAAAGQAPAPQPLSEPVSQAPAPAFIPAPVVQQTNFNQPAGSYRIKAGDTAWSLADAMRPDQSISVPQMMIAMLRSNPESFINENVNGLKRGYILRVPDYNQIAAINDADARAMVREQAALWRQYQQSQAGGQPVSAMEADDKTSSAGVGDDDSAVADEDGAYLEIVSAGSGSSTMSGKDPTEMTPEELRAELALARERVETGLVEKEALQQRVNTLEQHVDKMKGMLSIEDAELSEVQSLGLPAESEPTEGELLEEDVVESAEAEMAESIAETDDLLAEQDLDDAITEETGSELTDETSAEDAVFVDEASVDSDETITEMSEPVEQAEPAIDDTPPPVVDRAPADPLTQLLNDPMMMAAAGGGLLLIAALIGLIIKRRKAAAETEAPAMGTGFDDLESLADEVAEEVASSEDEVESPADEQAADSAEASDDDFDSDSTMILDSTEGAALAEADQEVTVADDEPRDDVIAEADVYLAYGIYHQAEELLTQAIADNPDRDDYRVKLAETHYASKNAEAFAKVAREIKNSVDSEGSPTWQKVLGMGQDLCPDNSMFKGSMAAGADAGMQSQEAPVMDLDLGNEEIEFDLSDTGAVEETTETEDELSLDVGIHDETENLTDAGEESMELDDIDIGLDIDEDTGSADEVTDVGDVDIDFGLDDTDTESAAVEEEVALDLTDEAVSLDMDLDEETDTAESAPIASDESVEEEISLDLTDEAVSLDMDLDEETDVSEIAQAVADSSAEEEDFDLSSLDDVDEISTKLDLARAYLDMGDHEGTRGILEEVLAEGNDEQKQEANELMAKLA